MPLDKIENKTLRQKVYEEFSESIINGGFLPGQKFSLKELAEKMGVSIMPVREALWQLESEKVVIIENNKRMFINTLNQSELKQLYKVRLFLETELAEKAFDKNDNNLISQLQEICDEMLTKDTDPKAYLKLNKRFHFSIYRAADNPIYLDIVKNLWLREAPYFIIQNASHDYKVQIERHFNILQAFTDGNKKELKKALKKDLIEALREINLEVES
ncbi:MAG: GntR family transcriptional regulator [Spirochaetales bacterium]|uniref:GntR family transcriptional regulator n=1 Tax=Candidatus Thalassospirochaeta sargassi TaxID=3119039 RepID=A0AAJ1MHA9_9SPIO|nr:GntR family transcriptional regulator [Spirochaetales bacterium]